MYSTDLEETRRQAIKKILIVQERKQEYDLRGIRNALFYFVKGGYRGEIAEKIKNALNQHQIARRSVRKRTVSGWDRDAKSMEFTSDSIDFPIVSQWLFTVRRGCWVRWVRSFTWF